VKRFSGVALGVLTAIGGFVDVGNIGTAGEAGSKYGYGLIWAILLGAVAVIFLIEMVGRLAAVSDKAYADIVREKFGIKFALVPLTADFIANFLLLSAEIGGAGFALYLLTNISFRIWAVVVGGALVSLLLNAKFKVIENGPSILGLVTLCFVVAVFTLGTPWKHAGKEIVEPRLGNGGTLDYFFIATGLTSAVISPYLLSFYSSGAQEEGWTRSMIRQNRFIAAFGMSLGAIMTIAIAMVCAEVLQPRGIEVNQLQTVGLPLTEAFGRSGVYLFAITLFVCCFGAAIELCLTEAFNITQQMGWKYAVDGSPREVPIFSLTYVLMPVIATIFIAAWGIDPLQLTIVTMVIIALFLPVDIIPFLIVMNDPAYLRDQTNSWIANIAVLLITLMAFVLSIIVLPLTFFAGGG
jgi:Mn2+/Fe2+ NRAMP family transporter